MLHSNFPQVALVLPGLAFRRVNDDKSDCRAPGIVSVTRSAYVRADHRSMRYYEGLLRVVS
jgi:hypothetical protein